MSTQVYLSIHEYTQVYMGIINIIIFMPKNRHKKSTIDIKWKLEGTGSVHNLFQLRTFKARNIQIISLINPASA